MLSTFTDLELVGEIFVEGGQWGRDAILAVFGWRKAGGRTGNVASTLGAPQSLRNLSQFLPAKRHDVAVQRYLGAFV